MTRPALTKADWQAFGRAAERWADEAGGAAFRTAVDAIVRKRMALAWKQGYTRGWDAGVRDATDEDAPTQPDPRNPYE